ncbi:hypothetical protein XELAEV_18031156mg [Xenopus laevis]|uniref:Uncharacterized protein n=1 Tax=Xenopus laevis TaxID=8355 RepID=A0A974CM31_XENLA|nr:hypothetical protein XELAEV_18031156mg [Xenopus laevis]
MRTIDCYYRIYYGHLLKADTVVVPVRHPFLHHSLKSMHRYALCCMSAECQYTGCICAGAYTSLHSLMQLQISFLHPVPLMNKH